MTITAHDRKILWTRAADRCAICRRPLTLDPQIASDPIAVLGEECHIVAQSNGGPRSGEISESELHSYANLVLLCGADHTLVDRQVSRYTSEALRAQKEGHERWVQDSVRRRNPTSRRREKAQQRRGAGPVTRHAVVQAFTGREAELTVIEKVLRAGHAVAVHGLGGIGKTRLLVEYLYRHSGEYDVAWWVRADSPTALTADLAALAAALDLVPIGNRDQEQAVSTLFQWLSDTIGGVWSSTTPYAPRRLMSLPRKGMALCSLRRDTAATGPDSQSRSSSPCGHERSRRPSWLTERGRRLRKGATVTSLPRLWGTSRWLLSRRQLFIQSARIGVAGYLQRLMRHRPELLRSGQPIDYKATVATTWSIAFAEAAPDLPSQVILLVCAFCASDRIPRSSSTLTGRWATSCLRWRTRW